MERAGRMDWTDDVRLLIWTCCPDLNVTAAESGVLLLL